MAVNRLKENQRNLDEVNSQIKDPKIFDNLPKTRKRTFGTQSFRGKRETYVTGFSFDPHYVYEDVTLETKMTGTQVTTSEGHPFFSSKNKGRTDIGGDFFTQKKFYYKIANQKVALKYDDNFDPAWTYSNYRGPVLPLNPVGLAFPSASASSNSTLDAYGATAIARVKPASPVANLSQALIELFHDGLPHLMGSTLWKDKTSAARNAGDEYLNVQFGWLPLLSDIRSLANGVTQSNAVISRYLNGVGELTKRRYNFPLDETFSTSVINTDIAPWPLNATPWFCDPFRSGLASRGTLVKETRVSRERWFSGAFTYFVPETVLDQAISKLGILAQQLGGEVTPEVLWNVAPWSWAADWFANTGDIISNYTAFHNDGLLMPYGYIMEHTIATDTYTLDGIRLNDGSPLQVQPLTLVTETKVRRGATPYGFGLNVGSLSGFQKSIMVALGLTKGFR
jgi:hypothetical protein